MNTDDAHRLRRSRKQGDRHRTGRHSAKDVCAGKCLSQRYRVVLVLLEARILWCVPQDEFKVPENNVDEFGARQNVEDLDTMVQIDCTKAVCIENG